MGVKCQMVIDFIDIRALLKDIEFSGFCHFRFHCKCSHFMKYLLTELGRFVRMVFCLLSLHRPRRTDSVCAKRECKIYFLEKFSQHCFITLSINRNPDITKALKTLRVEIGRHLFIECEGSICDSQLYVRLLIFNLR